MRQNFLARLDAFTAELTRRIIRRRHIRDILREYDREAPRVEEPRYINTRKMGRWAGLTLPSASRCGSGGTTDQGC